MIVGFLTHLGLFTTLYTKHHGWDEDSYRRGLIFLPLIGLLIGLILYGVYWFMPSYFHGFFLLIGYLLVTGGLHLDGYGDTLDGVLARRGRQRALEIMKDPLLGSFGIIGLIVLLLAYFNFLPELGKSLILLPMVGRYASMVSAFRKSYARQEGMGKLFVASISSFQLLFWLPISLGLAVYLGSYPGLFGLILSLAYAYFMGYWFQNFLGGMTGDTLGFVIETSQLVFMLVYLLVKLWIL